MTGKFFVINEVILELRNGFYCKIFQKSISNYTDDKLLKFDDSQRKDHATVNSFLDQFLLSENVDLIQIQYTQSLTEDRQYQHVVNL